MDDATKKIIAWIFLIIVVTCIFIGVYYGFKNTPLGKAFDGLFGSLSGATTALNKMINGCNKNGWASPKDCPLGFAVIMIGSLFGSYYLIKGINSIRLQSGGLKGSGKQLIEKKSALSDEDFAKTIDDLTDKIDNDKLKEIIENNTSEIAELKIQVATLKRLKQDVIELQSKQGASEQNIEETNLMSEESLNEAIEMSDLSTEQASEISENTDSEELFETSL